MGLTYVSNIVQNSGSEVKAETTVSADSSYPTGGYLFEGSKIGLGVLNSVHAQAVDTGYLIEAIPQTDPRTVKLKFYFKGGSTPAGTISAPVFTGTVSGQTASSSAPSFTGTSPVSSLDLASPAFSGTGLTAVGQVITTTDNQTMTLNQCAGMWLLSATGATPPNLILSNTAVTGAPAVLTVQGSANTDAGAYSIVKALTPIGTVSAPAITLSAYTPAGTNSAPVFTGTAGSAAALTEVPNTTDLSALTAIEIVSHGTY